MKSATRNMVVHNGQLVDGTGSPAIPDAVVLIHSGRIAYAGPRLAASGREICGSGGLMDWNPAYLKIGMEGLILLVNGPVEARPAARKLIKDGVEWIKTYPEQDADLASVR